MNQFNKTTWVVVIIILIIGGYFLFRNPEKVTAEPIKIGFIGPLSGDVANLVEPVRAAVELAQDEINEAGGINGRQIQVIFEDGKCSPKDATNAVSKLINIDKVKFIVGGFCSGETLAAAPIAEENKVILFSPGSSNPDITDAGDYIFRFFPSDNFQGKFGAEYIIKTLGKKKIALENCLSAYCQGIAEVFKEEVVKLDGEVIIAESHKESARDLRTQLLRIKSANPEVLYFIGHPKDIIVGLRQIHELDLDIPVIGADGYEDPTIAKEAGVAAEVAVFSTATTNELSQSFIDEIKNRSGAEPNVFTPRAYDIVMVVSEIIERVGYDATNIKDELNKVKNFEGLAASYTLDENGDLADIEYQLKTFKDGKIINFE